MGALRCFTEQGTGGCLITMTDFIAQTELIIIYAPKGNGESGLDVPLFPSTLQFPDNFNPPPTFEFPSQCCRIPEQKHVFSRNPSCKDFFPIENVVPT